MTDRGAKDRLRYESRREYMRKYQREWVKRRRAEFFAGKRCCQCGSTSRLEIHHVDPSKKVANSIWSWSKERREAELAKCVVLCASCHDKVPVTIVKLCGESNGGCKLTDVQIDEIRQKLARGHGCRELGREYGVSHSHISKIKNGHRRKEPSGELRTEALCMEFPVDCVTSNMPKIPCRGIYQEVPYNIGVSPTDSRRSTEASAAEPA